MKKTFATTTILAAALFSSQIATADPIQKRVTVSGDVDQTHRSIVAAATKACRAEFHHWVISPRKGRVIHECTVGAVNDAIANSRQQDLIAFHESLSPSDRYDTARRSKGSKDDMAFLDLSN